MGDEKSGFEPDVAPAVVTPAEGGTTEVELIDVVVGDDGETEIGVVEVEIDSDALAAEAAENAESVEDAAETVYPEDAVLLAAVDQARSALLEITPATSIGEVVGSKAEGEHVLSLFFATTLPGYPGWHWTVTMSRIDEESAPSVLEIEMLPGEDALVAPDWLPWSERLAEYQLAQELAAALAAAEGDEHDDDSDDDDDDSEDDESDDDDSDDEVDDDGLDLDDGIDIDDHVTDDDELEASADHADDDDDADDDADTEADDDGFDGDDDDDPHAEGRLSER